MLINLSNHPSSKWSESQLQAATSYGEFIDLPFPAVDPSGDETYIEKLAEEYVDKVIQISKGKKATVHLMGEMTLTFAILCRLQEKQIVCIASTSHRIVKDESPGRKGEVIFQFERFRKYKL